VAILRLDDEKATSANRGWGDEPRQSGYEPALHPGKGTVDLVAAWRGLSLGHGGQANLDFGASTGEPRGLLRGGRAQGDHRSIFGARAGAQLPYFFASSHEFVGEFGFGQGPKLME